VHLQLLEDLDQKNPELWNYKGVALRSIRRYDEAIECFNKSLEKIDIIT